MTSPSMSTTVGDSRDERQLDLAPIKARTEAATDAPWHPVDLRHQRGGQIRIFPKRGGWIIANVLAKGDNPDADAEFVAHAREDIPALIAEVESLRAILADLVDPDSCWFDHHGYCQAHTWLTEGECPHSRAKKALPGGAA